MNVGDAIGEIYDDPAAPRRFAAFVRKLSGLLVLTVVVPPTIVAVVSWNQVTADMRDNDLALSAVIGLAPESGLEPLLAAAGLDGMLLSENSLIVFPIVEPETARSGNTTNELAISRWRRSVRLFAGSDRIFTSQHPDGSTWWHSQVTTRNGDMLITSRPATDAYASYRSIASALAITAAAALLAVGIGWWVMNRKLVGPVTTLLDAAEDLHVRGEIRPDVRDSLHNIGATPFELQRMAVTLAEIEHDAHREFHQTQSLLQTASVLGASLEQSVVLRSALSRLQSLLDVERAAILRYDLRSGRSQVVATSGLSDGWIDEIDNRPVSDWTPSLRAVREGRPIQIVDTAADAVAPELRARARRYGYRSLLAVPVLGGLDAPTALVLQSSSPRAYSFDEIELSKSFASIASAALRNAELFERTDARLRQQTSRLEAITESVTEGLFVEGADGRLLYANGTMRALLPVAEDLEHSMTSEGFLQAVVGEGNLQVLKDLDALAPEPDAWCDVELQTPQDTVARSFRVRKFVVRDQRGREIGRGQTWTDVSRDLELQRMKEGILATVSHEFRTPLALIKGYATTLLADDVTWTETDRTQFLSLVSSEADRLTELVQRILDMRRIDAGMVSLQLMPVPLDSLVESVVSSMAHRSERIEVGDIAPVTVNVDSARIMTSIRNLLENGCTYSPPHEPVRIEAFASDGVVTIRVKDQGRGIEPRFRESIFDTFIRGESGLAAEHSGVGLGLAITRGFVEAHGGTVRVGDSAPGDGAEFLLELPSSSAPTESHPSGVAEQSRP